MASELTVVYLQDKTKGPKEHRIDKLQLRINLQAAAREAVQVGDAECLTVLVYNLAFDIYSKEVLTNLIKDAATKDHLECLLILLEIATAIDVDAVLISTSKMGHLRCLEVLCKRYKLSVNTRDRAILQSALN